MHAAQIAPARVPVRQGQPRPRLSRAREQVRPPVAEIPPAQGTRAAHLCRRKFAERSAGNAGRDRRRSRRFHYFNGVDAAAMRCMRPLFRPALRIHPGDLPPSQDRNGKPPRLERGRVDAGRQPVGR